MPLAIATFDEALALARDWVQAEFPDENLADDEYHGKWARVLAMLYWSDQAAQQDATIDWPPSDTSSTAALDAVAELLGLPNGAGSFGRLVATAAAGGLGTITGVKGTVYALHAQLLGPDGKTVFQLDTSKTIPGTPPGTDTVTNAPFSAVTTGAAGNLLVGAKLTWTSPPGGNVGVVVLTHGIEGGTDAESNSELLSRIRDRLQNPPKGGSANDWKGWAKGVAGIAEAYTYPLYNGSGSVVEIITQPGSGITRGFLSAVGVHTATYAGTKALVEAAFDLYRLVCVEGRSAQAPYMPTSAGCAVRVRAVTTTGNEFDWDSSGVTRTIDTVVDTTHLKMSTLMPADFKAAVDAGSKPRIQVITTGVVLPLQYRCTAYSDSGGKTTVTLEVAYTTAPTVGDAVHAGGNVVAPVAAAVSSLADSLGPSRVSGFADPDVEWDDTLRIDELIRVAMASVDGAGVRLVRDLVTDPTIAAGGGAAAATNVQAQDNTNDGPQLLFLTHVAVTP